MLAELVATAVVAAPPRLIEPVRVVPDGATTVLVADAGGGHGRVFRVDVRTGTRSVVQGSALGRVYDVERAGAGVLYIAADTAVYRLSRGRAVTLAQKLRGATDIVLDGRGIVFVESEANRVRRIDLRTRKVSTLVRAGLERPLALARARD